MRDNIRQAIADIESFRLTHVQWAEYFEKNPEIEASYIYTGEWDSAAEHRKIIGKYDNIIAILKIMLSNLKNVLFNYKGVSMRNFQIDFADGSSHGYEYVESYHEILPKIILKLHGKDKRYWPVNIKIRIYDNKNKTSGKVVGFIPAAKLRKLAWALINLIEIRE